MTSEIIRLIKEVGPLVGYLATIVSAVALCFRPVRNRIFRTKQITEGMRCLLRAEILRTYREHEEHKELPQAEFETTESAYKVYQSLGGNGAIKELHQKIMGWRVIL